MDVSTHDFFSVTCVLHDVGTDSDDGEIGTLARDGGCGARQTRTGDKSQAGGGTTHTI